MQFDEKLKKIKVALFDVDGDGIPNNFDNAPRLFNPDQSFEENENFIPLTFPEFFSPNGD